MNVGVEGYIKMDVTNAGAETGYDTVLRLKKTEGSAIVPTDASAFVGEFAPGETAHVTFKASVSNEGEAKTYPVTVYATYKDKNGKEKISDLETVGVGVGGKVKFEITSEAGSLRPGQKGELVITYKNIGDTTAYNAQARISAVKPFSSNDDTAYLGNIAPGESATGVYEISVSADATEKDYGIDTEIRYRDTLDNSQISDSMKAKVTVQYTGSLGDIFTSPIALTVIVFAILIVGYLVYQRKIKNND
ncbi:MAG: S-layer protein, partial [Methanomicrobium sp.]|nr:S-layer protein [Methanomicrobium sp.]